ncbi:MAG: hypothetical protein JNM71_12705 [Flavobacterium lindanitolerans]|uniref:hypothetical protein n=1 Tax=Flavobacterium lindanitolerans TaxID=428988 RepID=UPI001A36B4DA|nr:hypothetical protein [Flavobacterium lindanitolerans]MBL7868867.1 hypothetical protein [Flavobacterium lindanitolerans]
MLRNFTLLLLFVFASASAQNLTGQLIKDAAFKSEKELTAKYGKPIKKAIDPEDNIIEGLEDYSLEWNLKGQKTIVFYNDKAFKHPQGICLYNYKWSDDFYKALGWDKPLMNRSSKEITLSGLSGLRAKYNINDKLLIITLEKDSPIKKFGKSK